jgi:hypothetical protein
MKADDLLEEGGDNFDDDDPESFLSARDRDHLLCPFQCDGCQFVNIQGRQPGFIPEDALLLVDIC